MQPNILQLYTATCGYTVYGLSWIPQSARVLSVGMSSRGTGVVSVWGFSNNKLTELSRHEKPEALKCVTFGASLTPQRAFATGDHKGNLFTFDVERMETPAFSAKAHSSMVHSVDGLGGRNPRTTGAPEIATGGADGFVKLFDVRQPNPVLEMGPSAASEVRI